MPGVPSRGAWAWLFLGPDPQRLHLSIKIAALQAQKLRGTRHVSVGLFQLFEDVLALHRLADLLEAAEPLRGPLGGGTAASLQRNMARVDSHLRVQNHNTLDQV